MENSDQFARLPPNNLKYETIRLQSSYYTTAPLVKDFSEIFFRNHSDFTIRNMGRLSKELPDKTLMV